MKLSLLSDGIEFDPDEALPDEDEFGEKAEVAISLEDQETITSSHPDFQLVYNHLSELFSNSLMFDYRDEDYPEFVWIFEAPQEAWEAYMLLQDTIRPVLLRNHRPNRLGTLNINGKDYFTGSYGTNVTRHVSADEVNYDVF